MKKRKKLYLVLVLFLLMMLTGCLSDNGILDNDIDKNNDVSIVLCKIVLTANNTEISSDNKDSVSFTIKAFDQNGDRFEVMPKLYKNGALFEGLEFKTDIVEDCKFIARVGDIESNEVMIKIIEDKSKDFLDLKNTIDEFLIEDEINYESIKEVYQVYKKIIGSYNNETLLLKYLELKELFENTNNSELKAYANSKEFEYNLFFMSLKFMLDNASFKDKASVIISSFDNVINSLQLNLDKKDSEDNIIKKELSYFNKENYMELNTIRYAGFYVNAKNSFGAYTGRKLVLFVLVYTKLDLTFVYTL